MKRKIKFLDNSVFYVILGVVLAIGINWSLALALNTDMPVVAVESNSMLPTFSRGDILVLQGIPAQQLKIGDIIVFSPNTQATPVVHRIIAENPDGTFQTKGDANSGQITSFPGGGSEKSVSASQIHGKAIVIIPYLGWLKIGMMEYVLPNILWFILAGGLIGFIYIGVKFYRKDGFLKFW